MLSDSTENDVMNAAWGGGISRSTPPNSIKQKVKIHWYISPLCGSAAGVGFERKLTAFTSSCRKWIGENCYLKAGPYFYESRQCLYKYLSSVIWAVI